MLRTTILLLVVLTAVPAGATTDVSGQEVPFHVAVESFLSALAGAKNDGVAELLLDSVGLPISGPFVDELTALRPRVMAGYTESLESGSDSEDAGCEKARALGHGVASAHASEMARASGTVAPWHAFLILIDRGRTSIALRSDRTPEEFRKYHRRLHTCWAEGIWSVYPGKEVTP